MKKYKGRVIIEGQCKGKAVVSHHGLNTLAVFMRSVMLRSPMAFCADHNNTELYNKRINGKILCIPDSIGSTTAGLIYMNLARKKSAPAAILFSKNIDSLAAAGVILSDVWVGEKIITIDRLGSEFLENVEQGDSINILKDGEVEII